MMGRDGKGEDLTSQIQESFRKAYSDDKEICTLNVTSICYWLYVSLIRGIDKGPATPTVKSRSLDSRQ